MMERGCFIHHPLSLQIEDLYGPAAGVSFLISMISALSFVFAWLSSHILLSALREIQTARRQADVAKQRFLHRSLFKDIRSLAWTLAGRLSAASPGSGKRLLRL